MDSAFGKKPATDSAHKSYKEFGFRGRASSFNGRCSLFALQIGGMGWWKCIKLTSNSATINYNRLIKQDKSLYSEIVQSNIQIENISINLTSYLQNKYTDFGIGGTFFLIF